MAVKAEVTLFVAGEDGNRVFTVPSDNQDTAASMAMSMLQIDWSLDDRLNTDVELVGVRFINV